MYTAYTLLILCGAEEEQHVVSQDECLSSGEIGKVKAERKIRRGQLGVCACVCVCVCVDGEEGGRRWKY